MASAGTFGLSVRADNFTGRVWSVLALVVCVGLLTFGRPKADQQKAPKSRSQVVLTGVSLSIACAAIGVIAIVFASRAPSFGTPYGTSSEELSEDIVYISGDTDAWFAAYAPARKPRIAVGVLMVEAGAGGDVAAPVAREVVISAVGGGT